MMEMSKRFDRLRFYFPIFLAVILVYSDVINNKILSSACELRSRAYMLSYLTSLRCFVTGTKSMSDKLLSVDFEVFGQVQGVFFRKHTQDQAKSLGIYGWCKNTPEGTVQGQIQGPQDKIESMKNWLRNTGSPQSSIDKAEFHNEVSITKHSFDNFDIIRKKR